MVFRWLFMFFGERVLCVFSFFGGLLCVIFLGLRCSVDLHANKVYVG